ncbi:MAG TPA: HD family phosphohydrolase [Spirochaetia bacterium]|nr:HD family phosphohydrolase [Spirochaetia bacterium]
MNILYYGTNNTIKKELLSTIGSTYQVKDIQSHDDIIDDSILFVDVSSIENSNWGSAWADFLPSPLKLLINNVRVIAITGNNTDSIALQLLNDDFFDYVRYPFNSPRLQASIINAQRTINNEIELKSLYTIGINLSSESNLDTLLRNILNAAMDLTNSDGGSIYLLTDDINPETDERMMQFEHSISDTLGEIYSKFKMPINDKSLAGFVVHTGKSLNIEDVYTIPENLPYGFNSSFDIKNGYRTKSMLVVPMINHKQKIIGALQLINRKKDREIKLDSLEKINTSVIDFDHKCELLIRSLGSQATISIETSGLYRELHMLFESFMTASVNAVESRDPSTAGHSRRVSKLSVAIANHINMSDSPAFQNIHFSIEDLLAIKYAGLLHDFGKIGINEKILLKAKKLFDEEIHIINSRLEIFQYTLYFEGNKTLNNIFDTVHEYRDAIMIANEPGKLTEKIIDILETEHKTFIKTLDEREEKIINDLEYNKLVNSRGSLSAEEYKIIQSHVEHSYNFLKLIQWPTGLEKVPDIARYHHEKLDGSGYPTGIKSDKIPFESQIMCIADIFDALIASERPYKTKMTIEKAFDILDDEAKQGKINQNILDLFFEEKIYEIIMEQI